MEEEIPKQNPAFLPLDTCESYEKLGNHNLETSLLTKKCQSPLKFTLKE